MANVLSVFDPIFYAQQAILQLHNALGMARRVYRGYEKSAQTPGSTISIKIPSTFQAQQAPSNPQDVIVDSIDIKLTQWQEVKFQLSDQELAWTTTEIINQHITPAAYALANKIDADLCALATRMPYKVGTPGTTPGQVADLVNVRKVLFNNRVPLTPGQIHLMINGDAEANFLSLPAFSQFNGAGMNGQETQMTGSLGNRFGFEIFANQNVASQTPGAVTAQTGLKNVGAQPKAAQSVSLAGTAFTGTLAVGDVITFAGDPQKYSVAEPPGTYQPNYVYTANGNAVSNVYIFPHLQQPLADNTAATITQTGGVQNLAFHQNAIALAMAPLPDLASELGAKVATVSDPVTGLSLRSRLYYSGDTSQVRVALDVLYGYRVLDANKAAVLLG